MLFSQKGPGRERGRGEEVRRMRRMREVLMSCACPCCLAGCHGIRCLCCHAGRRSAPPCCHTVHCLPHVVPVFRRKHSKECRNRRRCHEEERADIHMNGRACLFMACLPRLSCLLFLPLPAHTLPTTHMCITHVQEQCREREMTEEDG